VGSIKGNELLADSLSVEKNYALDVLRRLSKDTSTWLRRKGWKEFRSKERDREFRAMARTTKEKRKNIFLDRKEEQTGGEGDHQAMK
jgi:hypothetical protein